MLLLVVLIVGKDLYVAGWQRSFKFNARHIIQEIESVGAHRLHRMSSSNCKHTVLKTDSMDALSHDTSGWADTVVLSPGPPIPVTRGGDSDAEGDSDKMGRSYVWNVLHQARERSKKDRKSSVVVRGAEVSLTGRLEASL